MKKPTYPHGPKSGWAEQALLIERGEVKVSDAELPMLLRWMQDMNWPGASTICRYIIQRSNAALEPIRNALKQGDSVWNFWLLSELRNGIDVQIWHSLTSELKAVANVPDAESAHIQALALIASHSLLPRKDIVEILHKAKTESGLPADDYREVEFLLGIVGGNP